MTTAAFLLRPDNFTPPTRTPWGGRQIAERYKAGLELPGWDGRSVVGESWELSVDPDFPSRRLDGETLAQWLSTRPGALGFEGRAGHLGTALLVKWLDAADELSVQIHPDDAFPELTAKESGKPECWYVVARQPGAGIHLGLKPGVDEAQVRQCLQGQQDLSRLLRFVPVEPGDFFCLEPGTPHAVGGGVTLIEPQRVVPGRHGVTYRYWDWNRRYDGAGLRDPAGLPRTLHMAQALRVTRWQQAGEPRWLEGLQTRAPIPGAAAPARIHPLCGPEPTDPVRCGPLRAAQLAGTGSLPLPDWDALCGLTVMRGELTLAGEGGPLRVTAGRTAVVPADLATRQASLQDCHALLSACSA